MKLYKFYKKPEGDVIDTMSPAIDKLSDENNMYFADVYHNYQNSYLLSAFTNNKKLAKEFKETRDMSKYELVVEDIDEESYKLYLESHSEFVLGYVPYNLMNERMDEILILSNDGEKLITDELNRALVEGIYDLEYTYNIFILNDKYVEFLWKLSYLDLLKALGDERQGIGHMSQRWHTILNEDYVLPAFDIDEVSLYTRLYSSCYKDRRGNK